ncbi:DUF6884 domain-containing protein [Aestuariimicrobium ganziense]|uniref:DUF6884 domain-containing protein n=1 Tax=Aestuariimicrobium ganziense TaxID=2773677 RepID=UPI0019405B9C|nr:DUF6884 domain-containing protein [Aestuariimicrobium ganziense]
MGCVSGKRTTAAKAKDLYTSTLFLKRRSYVEDTGKPWFILSALHGLVDPETVIDPYDVVLARATARELKAWGELVVQQLHGRLGNLDGLTFEAHAGHNYVKPLSSLLERNGATITSPLAHLGIGQQLGWYNQLATERLNDEAQSAQPMSLEALQEASALTPDEFLATGGLDLRSPGLYTWWIDEAGAADLEQGLGLALEPGLIYAGLAGATRTGSGRKSRNTLWGRIKGMHLGKRAAFSTFRRTLAAILSAGNSPGIGEESLTTWMRAHLRVATMPVEDADVLDHLESQMLKALDPPLNLAKMPTTEIRKRVSELRRYEK